MHRRFVQVLPSLAIVVLAACSSNSMSQSMVPQSSSPVAAIGNGDIPFVGSNPVRQLCPNSGDPQRMRCLAMMRTDVVPALVAAAQAGNDAESCPFSEGYCPNDLQAAYDLPSSTRGTGKTVAIVDAYGYSHAASDLAEYRKVMGLKACDTSNKCLRILNQSGQSSPLPGQNEDWAGEQGLDLDMVSAICPNCQIVLIEANNDYTSNLYAAVKTAGDLGMKYIGVSWGGAPEEPDNPIFHIAGAVIAAAAGDNGGGGDYGGNPGGPIQPCTFTYVVCVGGTHLVRADTKRGWSETVWNDWTFDECGSSGDSPCGATGSGCSTKIAKPSWQTDKGCTMRSAADTSATASLRAPVISYNTQIGSCNPPNCFWLFGGTSASTQIIAGVFALAENAANQQGASYFWKHEAGHVNNVTQGNNLDQALGVNCDSSVTYICTARVGFNGPTGWGTPEGLDAY